MKTDYKEMRILVTGAYGFIGTEVVAALRVAGHTVLAGVKDVSHAARRFPDLKIMACDFEKDISSECWMTRLEQVDAIVNCVGILHSGNPETMRSIHYRTPRALFDASASQNKKIVHVSALGADEGVGTLYAETKLELEQYLHTLSSDWVILRPSLVYGSGSFGGTSLFRALAALPFVIPVMGKGTPLFQPIHIRALAETIRILLESPGFAGKIISAVGPEVVSLEQLLVQLRTWLGFGKAKVLHIPPTLIKPIACLGNWMPDLPINTTSYKMLSCNYTADYKAFVSTVGLKPRGISEMLMEHPSSVQDRWHARLYLLAPCLRIALGGVWIGSGLAPWLGDTHHSLSLLEQCGFKVSAAPVLYVTTLLDIVLGLMTWSNWKIKWIGIIQFLLISCYTLFITVTLPEQWLDPFGSVIKNIPFLLSTLIMIILSGGR